MDWNDLKYCAHVAREGSTLAAARVLKISQTTVMRRLAALEEELGFELFEKRRAGYVPTEALRELLPRLADIEAAHTAFEHEAAHTGRSIKGSLRLTSSELLVAHFLGSALMVFSKEYPDIKVELFTSDRFLDLARGEADIAVRAGDPPTEPSLFGRRIVNDDWSICCSRTYAETIGMPRTVEQLREHSILAIMEGQFNSPVTEWLEQNVPKDRIGFRHNSLMTIYMSIKAGLGVSPCPNILSAMDRDLVRCMPIPVNVGKELWVLAPERLRKAQHARILLDFLANHLSVSLKLAEKQLASETVSTAL